MCYIYEAPFLDGPENPSTTAPEPMMRTREEGTMNPLTPG